MQAAGDLSEDEATKLANDLNELLGHIHFVGANQHCKVLLNDKCVILSNCSVSVILLSRHFDDKRNLFNLNDLKFMRCLVTST